MDAYGATYIPTVNQTPSDPKPPQPQSVVVKEPLPSQPDRHPCLVGTSNATEKFSVSIAYYTVEYKLESSNARTRSKSIIVHGPNKAMQRMQYICKFGRLYSLLFSHAKCQVWFLI